MNLSSKCSQILKLVSGTSSYRNFRISTTNLTSPNTRLKLLDVRKFDKRVKKFPTLLSFETTVENFRWRHIYTTSSSRSSSQKNVDQKTTATEKEPPATVSPEEEFANLGLFARFKKMYKEYWYVLVPVHLTTSAVWLGTFYYASKR